MLFIYQTVNVRLKSYMFSVFRLKMILKVERENVHCAEIFNISQQTYVNFEVNVRVASNFMLNRVIFLNSIEKKTKRIKP